MEQDAIDKPEDEPPFRVGSSRGRPPLPASKVRDRVLSSRFMGSESQMIYAAARAQSVTMSDFVRSAVLLAARSPTQKGR